MRVLAIPDSQRIMIHRLVVILSDSQAKFVPDIFVKVDSVGHMFRGKLIHEQFPIMQIV